MQGKNHFTKYSHVKGRAPNWEHQSHPFSARSQVKLSESLFRSVQLAASINPSSFVPSSIGFSPCHAPHPQPDAQVCVGALRVSRGCDLIFGTLQSTIGVQIHTTSFPSGLEPTSALSGTRLSSAQFRPWVASDRTSPAASTAETTRTNKDTKRGRET